MTWYSDVTKDITKIPAMLLHYENELITAKKECSVYLPGITEHRFNQLQEVEAVLNFLNIQLRKIRRKHFQKYLEAYQRALTSRDAEKYVDGEDEVIDFETLINDVALLRNKWLGILKGFESKNFMLGHIVRLRTSGMEDVSV